MLKWFTCIVALLLLAGLASAQCQNCKPRYFNEPTAAESDYRFDGKDWWFGAGNDHWFKLGGMKGEKSPGCSCAPVCDCDGCQCGGNHVVSYRQEACAYHTRGCRQATKHRHYRGHHWRR